MEFDIKKVFIFGGSVLIILFAVYGVFHSWQNTHDNDLILFQVSENDLLEPVLYYEEDRSYYLYGLEEVIVTYNGTTKDLKDFLEEGVSIEDVVRHMESQVVDDEGSLLYQSDKVNILTCKKDIDNRVNTDVYIGNSSMGYEDGFCGVE